MFTGDVGENAWQIRQRVCAQLCWLRADFDRAAHEASESFAQSSASRLRILVIPADEVIVIVREGLSRLNAS